MEKWEEYFKETIPKAIYETNIGPLSRFSTN